jgi:hypothetical protein
MTTYFWQGNSFATDGWTLAPGLPNFAPAYDGVPGGANDTIIFPAGSVGGSYTEWSVLGTLIVGPGAQAGFGNGAQGGGSSFTISTVILQPYSATTLAVDCHIGQLFIQQGASATFAAGNHVPGPGETYDLIDAGHIADLYNQGGSFAVIAGDSLQLGGPGFMQTGGFEPQESFYGDGPTHVLDLGTIAHGTALAPIQLGFTGSTALTELLNDPGLAIGTPPNFVLGPYSGPPPSPSFSVDPNTNLLGAHTRSWARTKHRTARSPTCSSSRIRWSRLSLRK